MRTPFHDDDDDDDHEEYDCRSQGGRGSGHAEAVSEWAEGAKCRDSEES